MPSGHNSTRRVSASGRARPGRIPARQEREAGRPLSLIDGMPIGIKDLISTGDLPTALGLAHCPPFPARTRLRPLEKFTSEEDHSNTKPANARLSCRGRMQGR